MSFKERFRPSYWEKQTYLAPYDVAIIGSGIVGLNAAITLKSRHKSLRVIVVERGVHPIGASTRNAGFACFGSISEVLSDINVLGYDDAIQLFLKRKKGLDRLMRIVDPASIDYRHFGGNEIFLKEDESKYEACIEQVDYLNGDLRSVFHGDVFVPRDGLISEFGLKNVPHLIAHPMEGQLHPGKLVLALMERASELGVLFANGCEIAEIREEEKLCRLDCGNLEITALQVLVAANGFAGKLLKGIDVVPARNQVLVTRPLDNLSLKGCFHYNEGYVYFRNIDGRILIGGARHIAMEEESTSEFGLNTSIAEWLENFLAEHMGVEKESIEYAWSGIMGVGNVKAPVIEMVSARIGAAVRLGGMGVAIGSLVGEEAADLIEQNI